MDQKLESGLTSAEKYKGLGLGYNPLMKDPRGAQFLRPASAMDLFGMVVGKSGQGKTYLFCSCPDALILNLDTSSVPVDDPAVFRALVWPGLDSTGSVVDAEMNRLSLTWDAVCEHQQKVLRRAQAGEPVPRVIVMDSIAAALDLLRDWVIKKYGKKDFKDLHGQVAYDEMYTELVQFALRYRKEGFGFYYVCHLVDKDVPIGEDRFKVEPSLTISASMWRRINWRLEVVAAVYTKEVEESYEQTLKGPVLKGKETTRTVMKTRKAKKTYISTTMAAVSGITKSRRTLPDVELSRDCPWQDFETAFECKETDRE